VNKDRSVDLILAPGTGFADSIFGAESSSRIFANSRVNWNGWGWDWTLPDGTTYLSPEAYRARLSEFSMQTGTKFAYHVASAVN
jgi:hypothetical protein